MIIRARTPALLRVQLPALTRALLVRARGPPVMIHHVRQRVKKEPVPPPAPIRVGIPTFRPVDILAPTPADTPVPSLAELRVEIRVGVRVVTRAIIVQINFLFLFLHLTISR